MHRDSRQAGFSRGFNVVVGALVVSGGVFVAYIATAEYEAIVWLKVGDDPTAILPRHYYGRGGSEYAQYRKTQAALIKSPDVLRAALNDPALANVKLIQDQADPEQWLKDNIRVNFPLESEVMQIILKARSKPDAVKIVDAVVDSYFKNVVDQERQKNANMFDLFDKEVKTVTAQIAEKQEQLARVSLQNDGDRNHLLQPLAEVSSRRSVDSAILHEEIKRKQELLRDHEDRRAQLELLMRLPNRVTRLKDTSE
jgi:capsular polysaccharide biosynthesis protein